MSFYESGEDMERNFVSRLAAAGCLILAGFILQSCERVATVVAPAETPSVWLTVTPDTIVRSGNAAVDAAAPSTGIRFDVPGPAHVRLIILDDQGRLVSVLVDQLLSGGVYMVVFDAANLSSGSYLYVLFVDNSASAKKMLLIK
jgi:hypothetical protein